MSELSREELLRQLIDGHVSSADIAERLGAVGWDSDREIVTLTRSDALAILSRFIRGEVKADEVGEWANAIEGREDIGYEPGSEATLSDLVFELANPEISTELTAERAEDWARQLRVA